MRSASELVRHQLLVGGEEAGAVFLVAHHQLDAVVLKFNRRRLGKSAAATLGIGRHADAAQLAAAFTLFAPLRERRPFRRGHGALHHFLKLTGIEQEFCRRRVGHRRRQHEIDATDGVWSFAKLARGRIDESFKQVCRLGSSGATIGTDRHGVGAHAFDVDVDRADRIEPGHKIRRARRDERAERRQISAEIGEDRYP